MRQEAIKLISHSSSTAARGLSKKRRLGAQFGNKEGFILFIYADIDINIQQFTHLLSQGWGGWGTCKEKEKKKQLYFGTNT